MPRKRGFKVSEETKLKMSKARKGRFKGIAMRPAGFKHSEETKAKMSAAQKGKVLSESHKSKCRVANLGRKFGPCKEETKIISYFL